MRTLDELIAEVLKAFNHEQNKKNLNKVFLSLQQAMISVLECKGNNNYKLKHMGKDKLEKAGKLPVALKVDQELINIANEMVGNIENFFPRFDSVKQQKRLEVRHPDQRPAVVVAQVVAPVVEQELGDATLEDV